MSELPETTRKLGSSGRPSPTKRIKASFLRVSPSRYGTRVISSCVSLAHGTVRRVITYCVISFCVITYCRYYLLPGQYLVASSPCYLVTLLPRHLVASSPPRHLGNSSPVTLSPCHLVILLPRHLVASSPCCLVTLLLRHRVTSLPRCLVTLLPRHLVASSFCNFVTLVPRHLVTVNNF